MKKLHLVTFLSLILFLSVSVLAVQRIADTRQNADEVDSTAVNTTNYLTIAGYVYIDENQNGERDLTEKAFKAGRVNVTMSRNRPRNTPTSAPIATTYPTPIETTPQPTGDSITPPPPFIHTDNQGYFKYTVASNTVPETNYFTVSLIIPNDFKGTTINPITYQNLYKRSRKLVEFGLVRTGITASPTPICGNVLAEIEVSEECEENGYRTMSYTCQDGHSQTFNDSTSCKTQSVWSEYAHALCAERGCSATPTPQSCAQVITFARNRTGQCRRFPTACLPEGWRADRSCTITPTVTPTPVACATPPICNVEEELLTGDPAPGMGTCPEYYCIGY